MDKTIDKEEVVDRCPVCDFTRCDNVTAEHIMDLHEMVSINFFKVCLDCGTVFLPKEYRDKIRKIKIKRKEMEKK